VPARLRPTLLVGLLAVAAFVTGCDPGRVICDYAADSGTFVGRLVERHGSAATFLVETVQPNASALAADLSRPVEGDHVVVHYQDHDEQFLHVGERYSVKVWPIKRFFSSVHTANHPCSGGTVHADGIAIDTSLLHQPHALRVLLDFVAALTVVGLFAAAWMLRKRRRQQKNVEKLVRSAS
jgi:hypothetical protein